MEKGREKEINEYQKYNSFEELYKDYKDIIDAEFAQRHLHRLQQLKISVENREKWLEAQIMNADGRKNEYFYDKVELLEEIWEIVDKELNIPVPYDNAVETKIREVKNKIIDELFIGRIEEYRGRGHEYELALKRASQLADIIEYSIKGFVYSKEVYNNDELIATIDKSRKDNYHKDKVLSMVHDTIERRDLLKMFSQINKM